MRHQKTRHKLSRDSAHRKALLANLCIEVIDHERIKTTEAKAKAVKPEIEKLITLARKGDLHARRQATSILQHPDKGVIYKLFEEIAPRYTERPGGYTRILKLGPRSSRLDRNGLPRAGLSTKLTLSYDGGPFAGWAAQPGQRTVAAEVVKALETVLRTAGRHRRRRPDRPRRPRARPGHLLRRARCRSLRSVNAVLPREIVGATQAEEVPDGFSARHDATSRTLPLPRARPPPAVARSSAAARCGGRTPSTWTRCRPARAALVGTHDFTAFTPTETYHQRFARDVHRADWVRDGDILEFQIEADSFMRNMNRILVGTMLEVAGGRRDDFAKLLEGAPRSAAGRHGAAARPVPGRASATRRRRAPGSLPPSATARPRARAKHVSRHNTSTSMRAGNRAAPHEPRPYRWCRDRGAERTADDGRVR